MIWQVTSIQGGMLVKKGQAFPYCAVTGGSSLVQGHYTGHQFNHRSWNVALHCTAALQCTILHCSTLHYTALLYTALHCTALHCNTFHCATLHYNGPY